ncbi:MAG: hypothetical protein GF308_19570 [Candidatus Heimdallarchaeota archaeon]|nr:hypothetical protein [Candidatus Heimdallarchaeota archaeon]
MAEDSVCLIMKVIQKPLMKKPEVDLQQCPTREIIVLPDLSLYDFAEAIVKSFDFFFDHCFGFYDNLEDSLRSREGYELFFDIGEESDYGSVEQTSIQEAFPRDGKKMLFLFDYGDKWHFIVERARTMPIYPNIKYPQVYSHSLDPFPQYPDFDE